MLAPDAHCLPSACDVVGLNEERIHTLYKCFCLHEPVNEV